MFLFFGILKKYKVICLFENIFVILKSSLKSSKTNIFC